MCLRGCGRRLLEMPYYGGVKVPIPLPRYMTSYLTFSECFLICKMGIRVLTSLKLISTMKGENQIVHRSLAMGEMKFLYYNALPGFFFSNCVCTLIFFRLFFRFFVITIIVTKFKTEVEVKGQLNKVCPRLIQFPLQSFEFWVGFHCDSGLVLKC